MSDHAREVRHSLTDPLTLCDALGWLDGHTRQARGVLIRCPSHGERDPSCSVTTAPDGTIRIKCFACDFSGDALTAVAFAHGLSLSTDFREVLALGAEIAHDHGLADEIRGGAKARVAIATRRSPVSAPAATPAPTYPNPAELGALWASCADPGGDGEVVKMLMDRGIDFEAVHAGRLARVIPSSATLPSWARFRGRAWTETGHRLLLAAWDHRGQMRSVRAWRVRDGDTPKRLPPGGHKASELVQANWSAVMMLRRHWCPLRLYVVEGEPDFLVTSTTFGRRHAVIGIGSGSWTTDFARAVSRRTEVIISTHNDPAGERYAEQVAETLGNQCPVSRWKIAS